MPRFASLGRRYRTARKPMKVGTVLTGMLDQPAPITDASLKRVARSTRFRMQAPPA